MHLLMWTLAKSRRSCLPTALCGPFRRREIRMTNDLSASFNGFEEDGWELAAMSPVVGYTRYAFKRRVSG